MSFSSLGLSSSLLQAINKQNFKEPYPIQKEAIPVILSGKDLVGAAKTGSGKTASYVLPILQLLSDKLVGKNRHVKALVLVPTRELAIQVAEVFNLFAKELPYKLKSLAVYGGVSVNPQMMQLNNTGILIATPGRLLDLTGSNAVHLSEVEILVLDEVDKMLNLGFQEEMKLVFSKLPSIRQNILFSATIGEDISKIIATILKEPVKIEIAEEPGSIDLITQTAYLVSPERKGVLLRYLIKQRDMKQVLVFVSSTKKADNVVVKLNKNGISAMAMHGQKSQGARMEALKLFKAGKLRVLVATDLASRGIDIQFLPFVINYELPRSPIDYVHRIGRTGRADSPGAAVSLISPEEQHHFKVIQKKMGKRVEMVETEELDLKGF